MLINPHIIFGGRYTRWGYHFRFQSQISTDYPPKQLLSFCWQFYLPWACETTYRNVSNRQFKRSDWSIFNNNNNVNATTISNLLYVVWFVLYPFKHLPFIPGTYLWESWKGSGLPRNFRNILKISILIVLHTYLY